MKFAAFGLLAAALYGQTRGNFELMARYRGTGGLVASAVAAGREPGSERLYLSYLYVSHTIDVVAVDPRTGAFQVFPNPARGESGARCMAVGPDGNIYLGTLPNAHFLKLDVKAGKLTDLGRPSATEQYIWDVAFGSDGRLYGATYPQSKLVRYDPASGKLEDLGRMDPKELYAHYVAGSSDGFVYIGIGTSRANIVAYEIATGEHPSIVPEDLRVVGQAKVYRGRDGRVYGSIASRMYRLSGWKAVEIPPGEAVPPEPLNRLRDGSTVEAARGVVAATDPKTGAVTHHPYAYAGNDLDLFRIAFGPDGELYGSAVLPIHLVRFDRSAKKLNKLGDLGGGEIYSFLAHRDRLLMAAYSGFSPLMIFDPARPFRDAEPKNPVLVNFPGSDSGWRPQALIEGPDGKVYAGAVAGYGKLGGPLTVWDVERGSVEQYPHVVRDQSVISLARWKNLVVGGTTTGGGGGSHPSEKEARLFLWNPAKGRKEFETVPVPGERAINDLIEAPGGLVYGIAGAKLFVFDPEKRTVVDVSDLPFRSTIYNAVAIGPDRRIWGLAADGIFAIDPKSRTGELVARSPERITGGFALRDGAIWFISGSALYRYTLPH